MIIREMWLDAGHCDPASRPRSLNQKPWLNNEVSGLLRKWDLVFKFGDSQAYKEARGRLRRGIKEAKHR